MSTTFKNELIKEEIKNLIKERKDLEIRLEDIYNEITNLQLNCNHKHEDNTSAFVYHSTDTLTDYHKCTICSVIKNKLKI